MNIHAKPKKISPTAACFNIVNHFLYLSSSQAAVIIIIPPYTNMNIVITARIVINQPTHLFKLVMKS